MIVIFFRLTKALELEFHFTHPLQASTFIRTKYFGFGSVSVIILLLLLCLVICCCCTVFLVVGVRWYSHYYVIVSRFWISTKKLRLK